MGKSIGLSETVFASESIICTSYTLSRGLNEMMKFLVPSRCLVNIPFSLAKMVYQNHQGNLLFKIHLSAFHSGRFLLRGVDWGYTVVVKGVLK